MSQKYNTNLASEYYVLSMLYRKGFDAYLTLGNKKAIDILIQKDDSKIITIDVKGLKGKDDWPLDNFKKKERNHFFILVSFLKEISNSKIIPECWIVPSTLIEKFFYRNPKGTRQVVYRSKLTKEGQKYLDNWDLLN